MVTDLDEFEKIAEWLESNLRTTHDRLVERVLFRNMEWHNDLEPVVNRYAGFAGRFPKDWSFNFGGFHGELLLDQVTVVDDVYDNSAYRDLFADTGIPIHQLNQSGQAQGGREVCQWFVDKKMILEASDTVLVSDREPRRVVKESSSRYLFRVFLFGADWKNLTDSVRVHNLLKGVA